MNPEVMFKLSYGLFTIITNDQEKMNGCIVNTVTQQTNDPLRVSVTINKSNYTEEMLQKSGILNVSVLDESASFSLFERFGFQSGRDVDKFSNFTDIEKSKNGIAYITKGSNAFISAEVEKKYDLGTHTIFIAKVTDGSLLSDNKSMTYSFYQENVKPKPKVIEKNGKQWICIVCGYIYDEDKEGIPFEELPDDWVCPLCKHGKSDFKRHL